VRPIYGTVNDGIHPVGYFVVRGGVFRRRSLKTGLNVPLPLVIGAARSLLSIRANLWRHLDEARRIL
jgi:hypothetical protein